MNYKTFLLLAFKQFFTRDMTNYPVGKHTYGRPRIIHFNEGAKLSIGNYCSISKNVTIFLGGNHRSDWVSTYPFPALDYYWPKSKPISGYNTSKGDITIGNDVWIGYGAIIMSGVTIGDGSVIGANAVVANDIPPYSIVVGNPGKVIKTRFSESQIKSLLQIKWWQWSDSKINDNIDLICSNDIQKFIDRHEK